MTVVRPFPQIVDRGFNDSGIPRATHYTPIQRPLEKLRKNRDDIESHYCFYA
jgi:hypothetical protein